MRKSSQKRELDTRAVVIARNRELLASGNFLKKSVAVIQCKPESQITFVAWKLLNVCYYHAKDKLLSGRWHHIHIDALEQYFNYEGRSWSKFNAAFRELQRTMLTFDIFGTLLSKETDAVSWSRTQFLGSVHWSRETKEFVYEFGTGVAKALASSKIYAKFIIEMQNYFSSAYTLKLYENCIRYLTAPNGSRKFSIQELKDVLGIDKGKYSSFKDFNKKVLKPAVEEINSVSDIEINVSHITQGKKVAAIKFFVQKNRQLITLIGGNDDPTQFSKEELASIMQKEFHVDQKMVDGLIEAYNEKVILQAMDYVRATKAYQSNSDDVNRGGYLVTAIRNGYKSKTQEIVEKEAARRKEEERRLEVEKLESIIEDTKRNFDRYKSQLIDAKIKEMGLLEDDAIYNEFEASEPELIAEICRGFPCRKKDRLRNYPYYRISLRGYFCSQYNYSEKCSFEDFLLTLNEGSKENWERVKHAAKSGVIDMPKIFN